jgi:hypothetical protein
LLVLTNDKKVKIIETHDLTKYILAPGEDTHFLDNKYIFCYFQTLYSFLSIGWGLISDIDIESERLRSIGRHRFTIWSLARLAGWCMKFLKTRVLTISKIIAGLRTYRGRISYCIAPGYHSAAGNNGPYVRRGTSENKVNVSSSYKEEPSSLPIDRFLFNLWL